MFRRIALMLTMLVTLCGGVVFASSIAEARYASIVVDADTGQVLHAVNADTRNYPASLTKMMTLYLVFEALEKGTITLDQRSEEHTSELQSLMRISYAVFCLKK